MSEITLTFLLGMLTVIGAAFVIGVICRVWKWVARVNKALKYEVYSELCGNSALFEKLIDTGTRAEMRALTKRLDELEKRLSDTRAP